MALAVACASAPRIVFPAGAGVPEPNGLQLWWDATQGCKGAQTFSAELRLNGKVGTEKLRSVTLHAGMTRKGEIALDAVSPFGSAIFKLAGTAKTATLTLPHDKRVLVAPAADIVEALIGVRLTPDDWLDVLSGCVTSAHPADTTRVGDVLIMQIERSGGRLRLDRDGAGWRIVAGERRDLLIEYRQFDGRWPSIAQLSSPPGAAVSVALNMTISQIFVNTDLPTRAFEPPASDGFQPMSLAELRSIGPLGDVRSPRPAAER
jgi:hypothetical protein